MCKQRTNPADDPARPVATPANPGRHQGRRNLGNVLSSQASGSVTVKRTPQLALHGQGSVRTQLHWPEALAGKELNS